MIVFFTTITHSDRVETLDLVAYRPVLKVSGVGSSRFTKKADEIDAAAVVVIEIPYDITRAMLCPEVWNFKAPKCAVELSERKGGPSSPPVIAQHYFNHSQHSIAFSLYTYTRAIVAFGARDDDDKTAAASHEAPIYINIARTVTVANVVARGGGSKNCARKPLAGRQHYTRARGCSAAAATAVSLFHPRAMNYPDSNFVGDLLQNTGYWKVKRLSLAELIDKEFIAKFVKEGQRQRDLFIYIYFAQTAQLRASMYNVLCCVFAGEVTLLSVGARIDTDDVVAVTPSGFLVLNLLRSTYQGTGLEGKPSYFERSKKEATRFGKFRVAHNDNNNRRKNATETRGSHAVRSRPAGARPAGRRVRPLARPAHGLSGGAPRPRLGPRVSALDAARDARPAGLERALAPLRPHGPGGPRGRERAHRPHHEQSASHAEQPELPARDERRGESHPGRGASASQADRAVGLAQDHAPRPVRLAARHERPRGAGSGLGLGRLAHLRHRARHRPRPGPHAPAAQLHPVLRLHRPADRHPLSQLSPQSAQARRDGLALRDGSQRRLSAGLSAAPRDQAVEHVGERAGLRRAAAAPSEPGGHRQVRRARPRPRAHQGAQPGQATVRPAQLRVSQLRPGAAVSAGRHLSPHRRSLHTEGRASRRSVHARGAERAQGAQAAQLRLLRPRTGQTAGGVRPPARESSPGARGRARSAGPRARQPALSAAALAHLLQLRVPDRRRRAETAADEAPGRRALPATRAAQVRRRLRRGPSRVRAVALPERALHPSGLVHGRGRRHDAPSPRQESHGQARGAQDHLRRGAVHGHRPSAAARLPEAHAAVGARELGRHLAARAGRLQAASEGQQFQARHESDLVAGLTEQMKKKQNKSKNIV
ncbi:unnamed protein product [Trichogramma brassicae]|uniref:Uncharacterized protein n=1 Tax=Trichogramma brassicae TaxID=86971 RepID=A0A6H5ILJ4_9HYME|nr:unnamed protein product [Trichogramma brassicae]